VRPLLQHDPMSDVHPRLLVVGAAAHAWSSASAPRTADSGELPSTRRLHGSSTLTRERGFAYAESSRGRPAFLSRTLNASLTRGVRVSACGDVPRDRRRSRFNCRSSYDGSPDSTSSMGRCK
jgi:hypothetical protein